MMQINKIIRFAAIIFLIALISCVKEFEPNLDETTTQKVVVSGRLTDMEAYQKVDVSVTSSLSNPKRIPLEKCSIILHCSDGKTWNYSEVGNGIYQVWLNDNELDLTKEYHIEVITPDHQNIVSSPESFIGNPPVDSIYYAKDEYKNTFNGQLYKGLQFFMDLKAGENNSHYYLIDVVETSEYHTIMPIEWWFDGQLHKEVPPDYSKSLCWNTQSIKDIYVLTTANLSTNNYIGFKLNFTDNHSQRLEHLYSINVLQYSISKQAYNYWNQMRINLHQTGGLYNNQPFAIKGNMKNNSNPSNEVLGYFMVSRLKEKRIFIPPQGFDIIDNSCGQPAELRFGLRDISPSMYPAYLVTSPSGGYSNSLYDKACVNCTSDGGTTVKPSFWP